MIRRLGRPTDVNPEDGALSGDLLRELRRLPIRQAALVVLRHLHGYTNREIAATLGEPESTVATRLGVAKRTLRARLGPYPSASSDTSHRLRVPPIE